MSNRHVDKVYEDISTSPQEHLRRALHQAWEDGWSALRAEYVKQERDHTYPIGRDPGSRNPYASERE